MSYIRTVKTIYSGIQTSDFTILVNGKSGTKYNVSINHHNTIVAQADTIEELCDEFVGVDKTCENGHQLLRAIPYKCANFWNGGVYGAIWTDKGLIYVAKVNDKGELELL